MQIKIVPNNYASIHEPLVYTFSDTSPRTFDVTVIDPDSEVVLGTRRFTGVESGEIDIAPMLRQYATYNPATGSTGFINASARTVAAVIEIDELRSPRRTFLPTPHSMVEAEHLTAMPSKRIIARGECDEITLFAQTPCAASVTAITDQGQVVTKYTAPRLGFTAFRLNTSDFPTAKTIRIDTEAATSIHYYISEIKGGQRIAWRSDKGSIEHYTFPIEKQSLLEVEKQHVVTKKGYCPTAIEHSRRQDLASAYEPQEWINAIEQVLTSPSVWHIEKGIYTAVEVINSDSGVRNHGTLRNIEIAIRHPKKILLP